MALWLLHSLHCKRFDGIIKPLGFCQETSGKGKRISFPESWETIKDNEQDL